MGCRRPPKRADGAPRDGAGGSEEVGDGSGAWTGSEVDGVDVWVGADAGVTCGERSEDVGFAGAGVEAGCSVKPKTSET